MLQERRLNSKGEQYVVGPTGTPLTLNDLPPSNTKTKTGRIRRRVRPFSLAGLEIAPVPH